MESVSQPRSHRSISFQASQPIGDYLVDFMVVLLRFFKNPTSLLSWQLHCLVQCWLLYDQHFIDYKLGVAGQYFCIACFVLIKWNDKLFRYQSLPPPSIFDLYVKLSNKKQNYQSPNKNYNPSKGVSPLSKHKDYTFFIVMTPSTLLIIIIITNIHQILFNLIIIMSTKISLSKFVSQFFFLLLFRILISTL